MAEKTLSAGTLGLRFMQHARRTHPHPEPERAPVKDDAEWTLPPGCTPSPPMAYRGEKAVAYETSYLPFLFPSLHDTPSADTPSSLSPPDALRPRGRRAFNKRGEEIAHPASSTTDTAPRQNRDKGAGEPSTSSRPHSISSAGIASLAARQSNRDPSRTAKDSIFDTSRVGTDLGHASAQATAFLRPAGVDGPADPAKTAPGATDAPKPRVKRSHTSGQADRPQKQTKLALIESSNEPPQVRVSVAEAYMATYRADLRKRPTDRI